MGVLYFRKNERQGISYRREWNEGTHKGAFIGCVRNIPETQQPSGGGGDIFGEMGEDCARFTQ